ncbi:hypothetical protein QQS21_000506 [Conoideocrella luteorostrata]|uniref:NACHT domain-containing protein n=1 Tax=Conoideocrella luteorostrata TaxID=1105319 RepID=A0AAJ0CYL6_9HYPO|nr:hypothetical protein QQS21_000506 [Conoideocrella luteorostrata]
MATETILGAIKAFVVVLVTALLIRRSRRSRYPSSICRSSQTNNTYSKGVNLVQIHPQNASADPDPDPDPDTDIDIIAIHGLDTGSPDTWIWKSKSPPKNVHWLADDDMLPHKVGRARIFTCDWPSDLFERSDLVQKEIEELARLLLDGINRHSRKDRPIIFIASCLGGIILMKSLVMANDDCEYRSIRRATRAVVFLATPFRGTSLQDATGILEFVLRTWASIRGQRVNKLLGRVTGLMFDHDELVRSFTKLCRDKDYPYEVMTFYETGVTNVFKIPWLSSGSKRLVDKDSATLEMVPHPLPLDRPHGRMNKFSGPDDSDYIKVAGKVEQYAQGIRAPTLLDRADACIRDNCYTVERLKIQRLSGHSLPMEQCYVNLSVVEKSVERADETNLSSGPSPFSLFSRQRVTTPDETIQVDLAKMFNTREQPNCGWVKPRRILIRGRAGVGKTTLCKKIISEFCKGTWGEWNKLFQRVLWVPLRNLKLQERRQIPGYNFEELFYHEYFCGQNGGRNLAREMWRALQDRNGGSLFILDGLDEVSQELEREDSMSQFLKVLLKQPNVIITTRPSTGRLASLDIDLELETIGFYPDQVNDYIEKTFTNREKNDINLKKVQDIQVFLQKHWLIQGLVRIPIQLDALCYTWDDMKPDDIPDTMTSMYGLIERQLWKKDILRLEKKHDGELLTSCQIAVSDVPSLVEDELYLLEGLAFTGLYNDATDFTSENWSVISKEFKAPKILLNKTLPNLSFLRASDPLLEFKDQNYHFIHLTFLEYFAARYYIRQWYSGRPLKCTDLNSEKTEETEPVRLLDKHKYTARYDIFWRFVAGLWDAKNQADSFLDFINQEPLDLLGPTHQRLVMHCLSEVSKNLRIRGDVEQSLSEWLLFECRYNSSARLAREEEFPEQALFTAFSEGSDVIEIILDSLSYRANLSPNNIMQTALWFQDKRENVRAKALQALGGISTLPEEILSIVTDQILAEGESRHIQYSASTILETQSTLSANILAAMIKGLQSKYGVVQSSAVRVLHSRSMLPEGILTAVVARLQDKDNSVRKAAVISLGSRSTLSEGILAAVAARLQDKDNNVRWAAVESLSSRSALPEGILAVIAAQLQDKDNNIREAAVKFLGSQLALPEGILTAVAARLQDKDYCIRWAAVESLGSQLALPGRILTAVAARLQDKDSDVREAAVRSLGSRSALPEGILTAVVARLQDKDSDVREAAVGSLGRRSALPEGILTAVAARLQDKDSGVRKAAVGYLGRRSALPERILTAVAARLQDKDSGVREAAVGSLGSRLALPERILAAVAARLQDKDSGVRWAAVRSLGSRSALPEGILAAVAARLQDKDSSVRRTAVESLSSQLVLPKEILTAVAARLQDKDSSVRRAAVKSLGSQSVLPEGILAAVVARLQDKESSIQWAAVKSLGSRSALPKEILKAVAAQLQDKESSVRKAAIKSLGSRSKLPKEVLRNIIARLLDENENESVRNIADDILQRHEEWPTE